MLCLSFVDDGNNTDAVGLIIYSVLYTLHVACHVEKRQDTLLGYVMW